MQETSEKVAIIVLNWNNPDDTLACIDSLVGLTVPNMHLIVVDNGSTDDSVARIKTQYPEMKVIETGVNLGYAGGNNIGVGFALASGAEFVCILNNDVIVEPDFLIPLLKVFDEQPDVGVVTPLITENGYHVWALGAEINWRTAVLSRCHAGDPVDNWRSRPGFEVGVAPGSVMLVKGEVFDQVGLLDESFFLYYEETDWCLRVRLVGYRILAVPSSMVWHKVSATLGTSSPVIDYYMLRNRLRLISRHWSGGRRVCLLVKTVFRNLANITVFTVKSHQGQRIPNRNARLFALRDTTLRRWGKMGPDVVINLRQK